MPEVPATIRVWNAATQTENASVIPGIYAGSEQPPLPIEATVWLTEDGGNPPDPEAPTQPRNLAAVNVAGTSFTLAWDAAIAPTTDPVVAYQIYQDGVVVTEVGEEATVVTDTVEDLVGARLALDIAGLAAGTIYEFTVTATNGYGMSVVSPVLQVETEEDTPNPVAPNAPTNLLAPVVEWDRVGLTWTKSTLPVGAAAVTEYRIYSGGSTLVATVAATAGTTGTQSHTVTGLTASTPYAFTVRAWNGLLSASSNIRNVTTLDNEPPPPPPPPTDTLFRAGGWYEKPLPSNAPVHAQSATYLSYLTSHAEASPDCRLVGAGNNGLDIFSPGYYNVTTSDPIYHIYDYKGNCPTMWKVGGPGIRIPTVAKPYYPAAGANDSPMMIYASATVAPGGKGYFAWFAMLMWIPGGAPQGDDADRTGHWRLGGPGELNTGANGTATYTASYGHSSPPIEAGVVWPTTLLGSGRTPQYYLDEPLNNKPSGSTSAKAAFRGCSAGIRAINYDRTIAHGEVRHVMEFFQGPPTASAGRWPMTGFEDKGGTIPEGTRMRIKPTVDVAVELAKDTAYYGTPGSRTATQTAAFNQAVAIAKGMQKYGVMVGDNSGQGSKVKLGSTEKQGRGQLWKIQIDGLRRLPFATMWQVVADFYDPPDGGEPPPPGNEWDIDNGEVATPLVVENFTSSTVEGLPNWSSPYHSTGQYAAQGPRIAANVTIHNGVSGNPPPDPNVGNFLRCWVRRTTQSYTIGGITVAAGDWAAAGIAWTPKYTRARWKFWARAGFTATDAANTRHADLLWGDETTGLGWPAYGELDFFEAGGQLPTRQAMKITAHWRGTDGLHKQQSTQINKDFTVWRKFEVIKQPEIYIVKIDGVEVWRLTGEPVVSNSMNLRWQTAIESGSQQGSANGGVKGITTRESFTDIAQGRIYTA